MRIFPALGFPRRSTSRSTTSGTIGNPSVYPPTYPSGDGADTPTGDSIDALMTIIQNDPPPAEGPTIIVLATDGEPDSCECPDVGDPLCDQVPAPTPPA